MEGQAGPEINAFTKKLSGATVWVQEEMLATETGLIMYRECMHKLTQSALAGKRRQIYLTGPPSSGKSIALAATVSALRAKGWMVSAFLTFCQCSHGRF